MSQNGEANPLLEINFQIPFDRIRAEHVEPAIHKLVADAQARLGAIAAENSPRTFENTMLALDHMTERLDFAMSVVKHLESVATYPELRAAYNAVQPEVSAFYSGIPLNAGLWKAVQQYAATDEAESADRHAQALSDQDHRRLPAARRGTRPGRQGAAGSDSTSS